MITDDLRTEFDRLVATGPPPAGSAVALAAGRRARRRRTAAGVGTAAAVAVIGVAVAPGLGSAPVPTAADPGPDPTAVLAPESPITAEQAAVIVPGCARAAGKDPAGYRVFSGDGGFAPDAPDRSLPGSMELLVGPGGSYLLCGFRQLTGPYRVTVHRLERPAPDPLVVDRVEGRPSDGAAGPIPAGQTVVAGRVAAGVRRVEVLVAGQTLPVAIYNRTFLAQRVWDGIDAPYQADPPVTVRAYDGAGRLLGTARP